MDYEEIPRTGDERSTLLAFLEWQRSTLERKCAGLAPDQLRTRSAEPSTLSLLPRPWHTVDTADASEAFASWHDECAHADDIISRRALDATGHRRNGTEVSMRWILN